jgi:hypothetical protein
MYYPVSRNLTGPELKPADTGKPWALKESMNNREDLVKLATPKYPIRKEFYETLKTILANHFEYKLGAGKEFY